MKIQQDRTSKIRQAGSLTAIDALLQHEGISKKIATALRAIEIAFADNANGDRPFMTVLLRTQGRRVEPLKDALLCLAAQTDQDFEVVIIDHDSTDDGAAKVRAAVASQPRSFRDRIRIAEVVGGSRSKPLNVGLDVANGAYISVFDDDDLLFANWVEQFHIAAQTSGHRLLRAQSATQKVEPEPWSNSEGGQRTLSWPKSEYARTFDQIAHLLVNHSPFMSWAFPRGLFTQLGISFDEQLDVCEDWDLILRASLLAGVEDVTALTSIYRRWVGAASSYTVHSSEIWQASEKRVVDQLDASVIVLPRGSVSSIRLALQGVEQDATNQFALIMNSRSWRWTAPLRMIMRRMDRVRGTLLHYRNMALDSVKRSNIEQEDNFQIGSKGEAGDLPW